MNKICIIEANASGHRAKYVRIITQALKDQNITLLLSKNFQEEEQTHNFHQYIYFNKKIPTEKILENSTVIIPMFDDWIKSLRILTALKLFCFRRDLNYILILINSTFIYGSKVSAKSRLIRKLRKFLLQVLATTVYNRTAHWVTIDKKLQDWLKTFIPPSRVHFIQDPTLIPKPQVEERPNKVHNKDNSLLFFGAHSKRKGTTWAILALSKYYRGHLFIRIAGQIEKRERRAIDVAIKKLPKSISYEINDGFIDDNEAIRMLAEAKAVALPYIDFGSSSGVINLAWSHQKPVVCSDFGQMSELVNKNGGGLTFLPNNPKHFCEKVSELMQGKHDLTTALKYTRRGSIKNFKASIWNIVKLAQQIES